MANVEKKPDTSAALVSATSITVLGVSSDLRA